MATATKKPVVRKNTSNPSSQVRKKTAHPLTHKPVVISDSDRRRMVSEAAYFLAEHRGFVPGEELNDWVQAELEIDSKLIVHVD